MNGNCMAVLRVICRTVQLLYIGVLGVLVACLAWLPGQWARLTRLWCAVAMAAAFLFILTSANTGAYSIRVKRTCYCACE